jgi:hypothetical protein
MNWKKDGETHRFLDEYYEEEKYKAVEEIERF